MPKIFNFPKLESISYQKEISLYDLLDRGQEHQKNLLDRLTLAYAADFYNKALEQIAALPADERTELTTELEKAYRNMTKSIESTSEGSSRCGYDCSHPYKNYGIEAFVPIVMKIDSRHTQELNLFRDVHGLFASTKTKFNDNSSMTSVSKDVVDIIMSYRSGATISL